MNLNGFVVGFFGLDERMGSINENEEAKKKEL
jgi:hypothetical protein